MIAQIFAAVSGLILLYSLFSQNKQSMVILQVVDTCCCLIASLLVGGYVAVILDLALLVKYTSEITALASQQSADGQQSTAGQQSSIFGNSVILSALQNGPLATLPEKLKSFFHKYDANQIQVIFWIIALVLVVWKDKLGILPLIGTVAYSVVLTKADLQIVNAVLAFDLLAWVCYDAHLKLVALVITDLVNLGFIVYRIYQNNAHQGKLFSVGTPTAQEDSTDEER